ncbi:MAG: hemerythrin domain-containing protein [Deltaproteobacteria bacterium]|nr:hemerythrin domain-containing protein [Deltaproteobacteria bacterium]
MSTTTQTPEPAARDLPTVLGAAHARLDALFEELVAAFRADAREDAARLWTELDAGLRRHFELEEEKIFPRLAEVDPDEVAALLAEHEQIKRRVTELGVGVDLHATRFDTVEALVRELRAHAKREDALAYPWAEKHLDEETRASIAGRAVDVAKTFFRDATRAAQRVTDRIF